MSRVSVKIDGVEVRVDPSATILTAANSADIYIPTLCAHPDLVPSPGRTGIQAVYRGGQRIESTLADPQEKRFEGCRLCVVQVEGRAGFALSCSTPVSDGMVITTDTPELQAARQRSLARILATHPHVCLTCAQHEGCAIISCSSGREVGERCCSKNNSCEIQKVSGYVGIPGDTPRYQSRGLPIVLDEPLYTYDWNLCIGCLRCVQACNELRGVGALEFVVRDDEVVVGTVGPTLKESGCKFCGACVAVCPTGAMLDRAGKREEDLVPCRAACPAGIDVARYVSLVSQGRFAEAAAVVREKVPFPATLGRVCFHPCEAACRRGSVDEPVSVCRLKWSAADRDTELWKQKATVAPSTGKRVAVIGSGPAGLTAAYYLARAGHTVVVFESLAEAGGMMRVGIPEYRLPRALLDAEIEQIVQVGVEIRAGTPVQSLDELAGYNAVYVALGAHQGSRLGVEGEELPGVMEAVSFLREVAQRRPVSIGSAVAIVGGGNAAIDAARTARRLGAVEVSIIYRRSRAEMPASAEEVAEAAHEGVRFELLTLPRKITRTNGTLGVELVRMELGEPDASGRRRPEPVAGSAFTRSYDTVIVAIGQAPEVPAGLGLALSRNGTIAADAEKATTASPRVFAGGDAVLGPSSVIDSIAAGRKAACAIDRYLGGTGAIDETLIETPPADPRLGRDEGFAPRARHGVRSLPVEERVRSFAQVELGYDAESAVAEASRCLRCALRLELSAPMMPPEKWLELSAKNVAAVPAEEGAYQLLDADKKIIFIAGTMDLRQALQEVLSTGDPGSGTARYFVYEKDPMYTKKESELIQLFLSEHGRLPECNGMDDDLFD